MLVLASLLPISVAVLLVLIAFYFAVIPPSQKHGLAVVGRWLPYIGCGIQFQKRGGYFLKDIQKRYGNLFVLYMGGKFITVVLDPAVLRQYYKSKEEEVSFFEGVGSDEGPMQIDRILPPISGMKLTKQEEAESLGVMGLVRYLKGISLDAYIDEKWRIELQEVSQQFLPGEQGEFDSFELSTVALVRLISALLVGAELAQHREFLTLVLEYQTRCLKVIETPKQFAAPLEKDVQALRGRAIEIIEEVCAGLSRTDTLWHTLQQLSWASSGRNPTSKWAAELVFSMIFAAFANTNSSLTWMIQDILQTKDLQSQIHDQLSAAESKHGKLSEAIKEVALLHWCLQETLRLIAPAIHLRKTKVDLMLEGFTIPKNSFLCTSPWIRHQDAEIFPNPTVYNPFRWDKANVSVKRPLLSFLTFGAGTHHCAGKAVATKLSCFVISYLLLNYKLQLTEACPREEVKWTTFGVVMPKSSIRVSYHRR